MTNIVYYFPNWYAFRRVPIFRSKPPVLIRSKPPPDGIFSPRKYKKFRRKMRRRRKLKPIVEHSMEEYLAADDSQPELNMTASDQLNRLNKGWSLTEVFGLKLEPLKRLLAFYQSKLLNDFIFGFKAKGKYPRREVDYNSLLTEVLIDAQIRDDK